MSAADRVTGGGWTVAVLGGASLAVAIGGVVASAMLNPASAMTAGAAALLIAMFGGGLALVIRATLNAVQKPPEKNVQVTLGLTAAWIAIAVSLLGLAFVVVARIASACCP